MTEPGFERCEGPLSLDADVVVVGSGAGGAACADRLALAGVGVLVLELGERELPASFTQREEEMIPRLFQEGGGRATVDAAITVLQGKGVGGSTLHNLNLCKRVSETLVARWAVIQRLPGLADRLEEHYRAVEQDLGVHVVPDARHSEHNQVFRRGAQKLGWSNGPLQHNRQGCLGSGYCFLGCAYDAKQNAAKVLLPRAVDHGARVLSNVRVERIRHRLGAATGVDGRSAEGHRVQVRAKHVVLAASATGSAALVLASGLRDRHHQAGEGLHLHPAVTVGGVMTSQVRAWEGIPQSWECTEHLHPTDPERNVWLVPAFGHPVAAAAMVPGFGAEHSGLMAHYPRMAACVAMLHDHSSGRVSARRDGTPRIHYRLGNADLASVSRGMAHAAKLLLAAGAQRVVAPTARPLVVRTLAEADTLRTVRSRRLDPALAAAHPMGGLRMAGDPRLGAVDPSGRYHGAKRLWVADGSLMPSSTGGPPQLTIYALGRLVGSELAAAI